MHKFVENLLNGEKVEFKALGEVIKIEKGRQLNKDLLLENGKFPVINGGINPSGFWNEYNYDENLITISQGGASAGYVNFIKIKFWAGAHCYVIKKSSDSLDYKYIYYFLKNQETNLMGSKIGAGIPSISLKTINSIKIPLPPLSVQKRIVEILDKFTNLTAELTLRKKQFQYYRDFLLSKNNLKKSGFQWKKLGEVAKYEQPTKYIIKSSNYNDSYKIPVLTAGKSFILGYTNEEEGIYLASKNPVIIFDDFTTANKWVDFDFKVKSSAMKIITSKNENQCLLKFIYYWLNTLPTEISSSEHKRQWISNYEKKQIPIPPLEKQLKIVNILDKFDKLTNSISEGLPKEIELREKQYRYYRDLLLDFN